MGLLAFLTGCSNGVMDPKGPVGAADRQLMLNAVEIMLVIVVPTIVASLLFAWWFRETNPRARRRPTWVYSGKIELLVWSVPLLTVIFLGGVIWVGSHRLDPYRPLSTTQKPLEVQVVSLDWKWLFIYPTERVGSVNELYLPLGVPVHFSLTSGSVMNAFFIPQLGSMIATMNGMVTQLYLQADHPGDYFGESTQFSGDGFSDMHFIVHAVSRQPFNEWIENARRSGKALDEASYLALAAQSSNLSPFTYRSVDEDLFGKIVRQHIPDSPSTQLHPLDNTGHP